jgi:hypothetical protein
MKQRGVHGKQPVHRGKGSGKINRKKAQKKNGFLFLRLGAAIISAGWAGN